MSDTTQFDPASEENSPPAEVANDPQANAEYEDPAAHGPPPSDDVSVKDLQLARGGEQGAESVTGAANTSLPLEGEGSDRNVAGATPGTVEGSNQETQGGSLGTSRAAVEGGAAADAGGSTGDGTPQIDEGADEQRVARAESDVEQSTSEPSARDAVAQAPDDGLENESKESLQARAEGLGVSSSGNKAELISRIRAKEAQQ